MATEALRHPMVRLRGALLGPFVNANDPLDAPYRLVLGDGPPDPYVLDPDWVP